MPTEIKHYPHQHWLIEENSHFNYTLELWTTL